METGRFLPGEEQGEAVILSDEARELKTRMLACFASQLEMIRNFPVDVERFRGAPVYDFTQAPHSGRLFYENFNWGITGGEWRRLDAVALESLGVPHTL